LRYGYLFLEALLAFGKVGNNLLFIASACLLLHMIRIVIVCRIVSTLLLMLIRACRMVASLNLPKICKFVDFLTCLVFFFAVVQVFKTRIGKLKKM
jgi:hypothetical protein